MSSPNKEELTTLMHSELSVNKQTEIQHRCFTALCLIRDIKNDDEVEKWANVYNVPVDEVRKNHPIFAKMRGKKSRS